MKPVVLLLCLFPSLLAWGSARSPQTDSPDRPRDLAALEQFLSLDDAQLDEMQQAIARVRAMRPEERVRLRQQIEQFRRLPPEKRDELRRGWGQMSEEIRDGWREMMQGADENRRAEIRRQLESLAPDERPAYRRRLVEEFRRKQGHR